MIPRLQQAADGDIQRGGGIGRKDHMVRPETAEPVRQVLPHVVYRPGCGESIRVRSAAAVAVCVHCLRHCLRHAGGFGTGGGGIVQIDHGLITFFAPASFSAMAYMLVALPTASFSVRP